MGKGSKWRNESRTIPKIFTPQLPQNHIPVPHSATLLSFTFLLLSSVNVAKYFKLCISYSCFRACQKAQPQEKKTTSPGAPPLEDTSSNTGIIQLRHVEECYFLWQIYPSRIFSFETVLAGFIVHLQFFFSLMLIQRECRQSFS